MVLPIDKAEQAKIAEVLSTVDRAIEETEALIAKQQRIMTGLMQDESDPISLDTELA